MKKVIILFLISILFSCSEKRADQQPKPLILDKEAGWGADIRLSVIDKSETDTVTFFKAVSIYNGKNLGFLLSVPKEKKESKGFGKGITMKSLGQESDNLLQVLSQLYNVQLDNKRKFTKSSSLSYVDLQEFARSLQGQENGSYVV